VETIAGPLYGFWLACYTVETEQGYIAYAKLCTECPRSVWDAPRAVRKLVSQPQPSEAEALHDVLTHTRQRLAWRAGDDSLQSLGDFDPL
jgi:hypothetical protein